ncbi:metallophosphoesterase [Fulvivirgaceae bacterium BMA10]|uniref:Metallophosphoesterase n=1 Tax=Splendidivirga corallicola TaxID=3051826 RepID=A0ABT8KHX6_9BACT|nr:metallophosphoesterase [Fulvivirgaceae bacterium BMA10]
MMKQLLKLIFALHLFVFAFTKVYSQGIGEDIVGDWTFHPNYTLARDAQNYPGQKIEPPKSRFERFKTLGEPLIFYEQSPTERITDFVESSKIPQSKFTIELWLLNHVNLPVGALITDKGKSTLHNPAWLLGYYGDEVIFHVNSRQGGAKSITAKVEQGWKKYWGHLVGTYDGETMKLYLNGVLLTSSSEVQGDIVFPDYHQIELAGYFKNEPYMKIANLVKASRLYDGALDQKEIKSRFMELQTLVDAGKLFQDTFHFNAGPYLHFATQNSINIVWETDRLTQAVVEYGRQLPLTNKKKITNAAYIQEVTLENLVPETPYYYQITAIAQDGTEMKSGVLTFGTGVKEEAAFSFCIIGDTESRPHINHHLGEMIWEERPNFIVHLGDVTDGGKEPHKFEWNYEYFTGITPVASRIPVFPVPGNGESDLYWYNRYHRLPEPEAFYTFNYGNAQFFMLNSNENEELKKGGKQYAWLEEKLTNSKAKWKFVAHHHCPVSSDENDYGNTWKGETSNLGDPKFDDLKKLYETAGVDVVFYGHVHAYERSWPLKDGKIDRENGVIYVQSGGAGGHLEDFTPTHSWFSNKTQRGNHYCKVDIFDNIFSFKMYDLDGKLKDFLELTK